MHQKSDSFTTLLKNLAAAEAFSVPSLIPFG
jgi:hypothetical protein